MAKRSGLGLLFAVAGVDLSGDTGSINRLGGGPNLLDATGLDKSANERIPGLLDGALDYTTFFNPTAGQAHTTLRGLPTSDVIVTLALGSTLGDEEASIVAKQLDYAGSRAADGAFTFTVPGPANGYGLEWGNTLTAGKRTDTTATNGASLDNTVATTTTGWSAYLHVFAFTGTSVTVTLQDSADNAAFAGFTGSAFIAATGITTQRIEGAVGATVRRYVRAVTTGTFSNAVFLVGFSRHPMGAAT